MPHQARMQDELALVSVQLESLCQQWRKEAAKQEQNNRLMKMVDEEIYRAAAEYLRPEEHAKWLEAQATGEQSFLSQWIEKREC